MNTKNSFVQQVDENYREVQDKSLIGNKEKGLASHKEMFHL